MRSMGVPDAKQKFVTEKGRTLGATATENGKDGARNKLKMGWTAMPRQGKGWKASREDGKRKWRRRARWGPRQLPGIRWVVYHRMNTSIPSRAKVAMVRHFFAPYSPEILVNKLTGRE